MPASTRTPPAAPRLPPEKEGAAENIEDPMDDIGISDGEDTQVRTGVGNRRSKTAPLDLNLDTSKDTLSLIDWIESTCKVYTRRHFPQHASNSMNNCIRELRHRWFISVEDSNRKLLEMTTLLSELAQERKSNADLKNLVEEITASTGSKKRKAPTPTDLLKTLTSPDHTDNMGRVEETPLTLPRPVDTQGKPKGQTIGFWENRTAESLKSGQGLKLVQIRDGQRKTSPPPNNTGGSKTQAPRPPARSPSPPARARKGKSLTEPGSWTTVARKGKTKGKGPGGSPDPSGKPPISGTVEKGKPGVVAVTTADKVQENGSWTKLTETELNNLREIVRPILDKVRVLNTFPTRGGLGILIADDVESSKVRNIISHQTKGTLVTKFVAKDEMVLRIGTPVELQLGKEELSRYLREKNGLNMSRVEVTRRAKSGAYIIKGPKQDLEGVLRNRRVFVGLSSYRVTKLATTPLCYRCGKLHMVFGDRCTADPQCINCGRKHQVRECPEKKGYRGIRKCSVCNSAFHSALEGKCDKTFLKELRAQKPTLDLTMSVQEGDNNSVIDSVDFHSAPSDGSPICRSPLSPTQSSQGSIAEGGLGVDWMTMSQRQAALSGRESAGVAQ